MWSPLESDLYHIKWTMTDFHKDPSGATQTVRICGTYTDLDAAKAAAQSFLKEKGFDKDWFTTFDVHDAVNGVCWKHGDGVMVYAVAPDGETFTIEIETTPNTLGLRGNDEGQVEEELYHVLQTTIFYDKDRSGACRETNVEGSWKSYNKARIAAAKVLLDEDVAKSDFVKYDENKGQDDWEYGEDVVVHAVGANGENILVSMLKSEGSGFEV